MVRLIFTLAFFVFAFLQLPSMLTVHGNVPFVEYLFRLGIPVLGIMAIIWFDKKDSMEKALRDIWVLLNVAPKPKGITVILWATFVWFTAYAVGWEENDTLVTVLAAFVFSLNLTLIVWRAWKKPAIGSVLLNGSHVIGYGEDGGLRTMRDVHTSGYRKLR